VLILLSKSRNVATYSLILSLIRLDVANGTKDKALPAEARAIPADKALYTTATRTTAAESQNGRQDKIAAAIMSALPPPGWEREVPRYRVTRDIHPSPNSRHRFEPPFASLSDSGVWQYGAQPIKAGEIIETREWPHPSFHALNYGAGKVLDFFNMRQKSRLPRSPWQGNRLVLDDGLTGTTQPKISINSGVTAA
jgi:hypothetical protein